MSFHETILDLGIDYGTVGGPRFNTQIVETAAGFEYRNSSWQYPRAEYEIGDRLVPLDKLEYITAFFNARRGRAYGFRYKDWADYRLSYPAAANHVGLLVPDTTDPTKLYAYKRYSEGGIDLDRRIWKLDPSVTPSVYKNSSVITPAAIDYNTGTITVAPADADAAATWNIAGQFHVPVRFDTDHLTAQFENMDADGNQVYYLNNLRLIEIKLR